MSILHYCDTQCTAVFYSDWSLQMGQMGPKMTLGTLTVSGDNFPGGPSGAQIGFTIGFTIYERHLSAIKCSKFCQYIEDEVLSCV